VTATAGQTGVTIAVGVALDPAGHVIAIAAGGFAVVDQTVDPNQVANVPAVPVDPAGVALDTTGFTGELLVTATWREVLGDGQLSNAPVLVHAPWLRLQPAADVPDGASPVVLAAVTLDANGLVTALTTGPRRQVAVPTSRVEIRRPHAVVGPPLSVQQEVAAELLPSDDGGLALNLTPAGGAVLSVLTIDAAAANLGLLPGGGQVGIGLGEGTSRRSLHVEGSEVHSGGTGGGFSFADRSVGSFVELPAAGERWVWYASGGVARLWSGGDVLSVSPQGEGNALDVPRRMRVRQGGDASAGIWFFQSGAQADRGFVGMADDTTIGFWGNTGSGWGLRMDTSSGALSFGGDFGRAEGPSTISLWASRIGDVGNGILFLRSGGGVVAFDGGDSVGVNTTAPLGQLGAVSTHTAVSGVNTADGLFVSGVYGEGQTGVFANGRNVGVFASGSQSGITAASSGLAGQFFGDVNITGTLSKGGGGFRIDHPLDPEHKYLSHSFVESPEMLNVYRGTVTTNASGGATIELPNYVEALNTDFSYHLTPVGGLAQAAVTETIDGNRFSVVSDPPGATLSWLVLGVRADPWAVAHRIAAEEDKDPADRGYFLHPDERDQPEVRGIAHRLSQRPPKG
jgi:hypothetical protein